MYTLNFLLYIYCMFYICHIHFYDVTSCIFLLKHSIKPWAEEAKFPCENKMCELRGFFWLHATVASHAKALKAPDQCTCTNYYPISKKYSIITGKLSQRVVKTHFKWSSASISGGLAVQD